MDQGSYLQVVGAVVVGNIITLWLVYGIWMLKQDEKRGGGGWTAPLLAYFLLAAPMLFGAWSAWASTQ
jgi:hypothetical protein